MKQSKIDRVLARLPMQGDGCWLWPGAVTKGGYGRVWVQPDDGTSMVHRIMYETLIGPIPAGMQLDHSCHAADPTCNAGDSCPHRRCANPDHLVPVTPKQNTSTSRAVNVGKTHCKYGHEFTPENTIIRAYTGWRQCRACHRREAHKGRGKHSRQ
jgi:hypothetical protein